MVHNLKLRYADFNGIFLKISVEYIRFYPYNFSQIYCLYYKENNFHFVKE